MVQKAVVLGAILLIVTGVVAILVIDGASPRIPALSAQDTYSWTPRAVAELAKKREGGPASDPGALSTSVASALAAYGKHWQGSVAAQMEYEAGYVELAGHVAERASLSHIRDLASTVRRRAETRLAFLQDPQQLEARLHQLQDLLAARKWSQAAQLCAELEENAYADLPGVELAHAQSLRALGEKGSALTAFSRVAEKYQTADPRVAAAAVFLAAETLKELQRYDEAVALYAAFAEDFPDDPLSPQARELAATIGHAAGRPAARRGVEERPQ